MTYFPEDADPDLSATPGGSRGASPGDSSAPPRLSLRQRAAAFWLNFLFFWVGHAPWVAKMTVHFWIWAAWIFSPALRQSTLTNARWLLGPKSTPRQRARLARQVLKSFFLFVYDVGRHGTMTLEQMRRQLASIEGNDHYEEARKLKRGVILATAHFGSFEAAVAALHEHEPRIHAVFRRDRFNQFDDVRRRLRERLGVIETPIDGGIAAWAKVREALERDEAVLMQADRVMPGQRGVAVPFLGGHIEVPIGPVKLGRLTGAPIMPVFAIRLPDGKVRIEMHPAILVDQADDADWLMPAVLRLAAIIESYVGRYPQQWLALHQPWIESEAKA